MNDPAAPLTLKCPVCSARFRQATECPRCKTDLSLLMRIAVRAWVARQRCQGAMLAGDLAAAFKHHDEAVKLQRTHSI